MVKLDLRLDRLQIILKLRFKVANNKKKLIDIYKYLLRYNQDIVAVNNFYDHRNIKY